MYGIVSDSYKNLVKLKTKKGELVLKSNKKIPKGLRIEVKKIGQGDYEGKILLGPKSYLPPIKYIFLANRITDDPRFIERLSVIFEELEKRIKINRNFLERFEKYFKSNMKDEENLEFEVYLNALSGRYGLRSFGDIKVFFDRVSEKFEIFYEKEVIVGYVNGEQISLSTSSVIENVEELKSRLSKYFKNVFIKFEGFKGGVYV
ncbi:MULTISPECIES: hypothetical protein [unclassified Thermosipho (in: thermotogales)]|uniref:hypothetical protein n=1 Tax=unclassified Thermosipho (in: thermotogales) TaxID=2676525 RepID=UPI000986C542|nr:MULTISPECIES: hypothetical protein [unclassified Thermosipho (in: thermotogales)]MBT1247937.1 hypothetical protein [Thermosipho sp. 1244]OOC46104.1 hypothetical protein XO09_08290 [Thermosipho sp. 1223]